MANKGKPGNRTRHSKATKKPVTIDLDAKDVKKIADSKPAAAKRSVPSAGNKPAARKSAADTKTGAKPEASKSQTTRLNKQAEAKPAPATPAKPEQKTTLGMDGKPAHTGGKNEPIAPKPAPTSASVSVSAIQDSKSGWGISLIAACIGGIVAICLAGLLQYTGILSMPSASTVDTEATAQLESRIAGLEERLAAQSATAATGETVTKLVDERLSAQSTSLDERISEVEGIVAQLRDQLGSIRAETSTDAATTARIDELAEEVATLRSASQTSGASATGDKGASSARLVEITAAAEQIQADLNARIETIFAKLDKTDAGQVETKTALAETNAKLGEAVARIGKTNAEITALRDRVENGADKRAATAIAAAALKNDIDSGEPFATALSNLKAFSPGMLELESLDFFAQKGVPTIAQLSAEFGGSVSGTILEATAPVENDSLASRLAAGARSLVEVKPIGVVDGKTPEARVSQIAEALKNGDLLKASETWATLPDAGREASARWHTRLQARLTANSIVKSTVENILNSSRGG
ncbi:MAG: hypothetical protein ACR2PF_10550 [Rhizobiaceae bacterium]